jgi:hypothetical protein
MAQKRRTLVRRCVRVPPPDKSEAPEEAEFLGAQRSIQTLRCKPRQGPHVLPKRPLR